MLCHWKVFFLFVAITAKFKSISSTVSEYHKALCLDYHRLNVVEAFSIHNGRTIIDDSPSFGPQPLKVCMVTFITKDILSYALYSLLLNRFYASLHNFDFFVVDSESGGQMELDGHDARWNKVKILHFAISSQSDWSSHCDYVLWVDADWTVLDMNWSITGLVSANPEAHILTSAEHSGSTTTMNSGSILVRNSLWSQAFLEEWWTLADRRMYSDQEQFDMLYQHRSISSFQAAELRKKVQILPPEVMNSDPPAMTNMRSHHQVLHLMGEENEFRRVVFHEAWTAVCQTVEQSVNVPEVAADSDAYRSWLLAHVPHQLSVNQQRLLELTISVYGQLLQQDFNPLLRCLDFPHRCQQESPVTLETGRRWSNTVHHYVHALDHCTNETILTHEILILRSLLSPSAAASDVSIDGTSVNDRLKTSRLGHRLRHRLYQWLKYQLQRWHEVIGIAPVSSVDSSPLSPSNIPSDYPEMVKSVAIAAQHLLPAVPQQTLSVEDRMIITDEIEHYLERMMVIAHPDQHPAIQQMAMHHLMQEGDMAYQELNNIAVAVICFERAVEIARAISPVFGSHHLIQPLTMLANVQALNRDFASALSLYEEATTYGRRQWGPWHLALAHLYYNYARACYEADNLQRSEQLIQNVESILTVHHSDEGESDSLEFLRSKVSSLRQDMQSKH